MLSLKSDMHQTERCSSQFGLLTARSKISEVRKLLCICKLIEPKATPDNTIALVDDITQDNTVLLSPKHMLTP